MLNNAHQYKYLYSVRTLDLKKINMYCNSVIQLCTDISKRLSQFQNVFSRTTGPKKQTKKNKYLALARCTSF